MKTFTNFLRASVLGKMILRILLPHNVVLEKVYIRTEKNELPFKKKGF